MNKSVLLIGLFVTVVLSCRPQTHEAKDITVEDLQMILENENTVQLLDVRTPEEWAEGVIETPIKIDVTGDDFEGKALEKLDKTKPVYVYCRSGVRSKRATELLVKKGYNAYNVLGGYLEWTEKK
ncbi:rhodanese-like domain-containing protein [Tenacibaculum tangerinum]|uniref:Rhodanese-like domain-containing protein n=1 Tax=Tenacibaculum tangerinum TaxID=3038772 RepID=A0ABY8L281_9FLAO|nr:rhodanese-like domain-containing protein [Tenacibaculum tangerinum]WGH74084.1 rhodanese-like domain-containing protein [Tenacibaculum tangerinum]